VEGHAGYAKAGKDIVCAAASATAYTAAGALSELAGLSGAWAERDGYFEISVPASHGVPAGHVGAGQAGSLASSGCAEAALGSPGAAGGQGAGTEAIIDIIMETAYIGYRQIAEAYPRHLELVCR
jgi:uncharacterized protein YsxB (DUF464 family)